MAALPVQLDDAVRRRRLHFLWSIGLMEVDAQVYRLVWWGLGHSSQQINVAARVVIWYLLGAVTVGAVVVNEKLSRTAFVLSRATSTPRW